MVNVRKSAAESVVDDEAPLVGSSAARNCRAELGHDGVPGGLTHILVLSPYRVSSDRMEIQAKTHESQCLDGATSELVGDGFDRVNRRAEDDLQLRPSVALLASPQKIGRASCRERVS